MPRGKACFIILIVIITGLAGGIFVYNNHSLHEKDPWYHTIDQDMFISVEAMALNSGLSPAHSIHPGFGTKLFYSYFLSLMKKIGTTPVSAIDDLEQSPDPLTYWPWVIGSGRIFSLVSAIILCVIIGGIAWQLTGSMLFFPLGFFMGTVSYGIMYQSLIIRTELFSAIFGCLAFLFMLLSLRTRKTTKFVTFLMFSGLFAGFAIYTKIQTYPFIAVIIFWFLFVEKGCFEEETMSEDISPYTAASSTFRKGLFGIFLQINYSYFFRILPAIILTFVSILVLPFCTRYPPYYIPALSIIALFGPLCVLRPGNKKLSWLYVKLEVFCNFLSGLIFSLIVPLVFLIPKIGISASMTYWGKTLWAVYHPWVIYEGAKCSNSLNVGLQGAVHYIMSYLSLQYGIIALLAYFLVFCRGERKENCILFILITISYAVVNSLRSYSAAHYIIYTDTFFICAIILAFSGIQKHLIKMLRINKVFITSGTFAVFVILTALSGVAQFDKLKTEYMVEPSTHVHGRIYEWNGWYVKRYDKAMEKAYKNLQGFNERGRRFLQEDENNYVRYN